MFMMKRIFIIVCAVWLSIGFLDPETSHACSCVPPPPPKEAMESSSAVFSGKVRSIDEPKIVRSSIDPVTVTMEVKEVWKGDAEDVVKLKTALSTASCGYHFEVGAEYIVYAYGEDGEYHTGLCTRTAPLSNAEEDLQALGEGKVNPDYGLNEPEQIREDAADGNDQAAAGGHKSGDEQGMDWQAMIIKVLSRIFGLFSNAV